jgi:hypothetical protein
MLKAEDVIRKQINRDEDCTEAALRLMAMRTTLLGLIGERTSGCLMSKNGSRRNTTQ